MTEAERKQIIALVQREVVPAIGCTEPIAVALCVAKATETLGAKPEKIDVLLSANILKNAMGVGIPGTIAFPEILLGFSGEADNDIRCQRNLWQIFPERCCRLPIFLRIIFAVHFL